MAAGRLTSSTDNSRKQFSGKACLRATAGQLKDQHKMMWSWWHLPPVEDDAELWTGRDVSSSTLLRWDHRGLRVPWS